MKKILLLPKWLDSINTKGDFLVRTGKLIPEDYNADIIIGVSLGALIALREFQNIKGKLILINPPLPKRNLVIWFFRWIKFILSEGLNLKENHFTKNPIRFFSACVDCVQLLNMDYSNVFKESGGKKIFVVRGAHDVFFCDTVAALFLKTKNISLSVVDGGHNWSQEMDLRIEKIVKEEFPI